MLYIIYFQLNILEFLFKDYYLKILDIFQPNILYNDERQYLNFDIQKICYNEFYSISNKYNNTLYNSLNGLDYSFILAFPNNLQKII